MAAAATKWSQSERSSFINPTSFGSPSTSLYRGWESYDFCSRPYLLKLSRPTTSYPLSSSSWIRYPQIKPEAPVTSTFTMRKIPLLQFAAGSARSPTHRQPPYGQVNEGRDKRSGGLPE